jgi:alpha-galactosidase
LDAWTLALLTNPEVIEVNQDPLSQPAARILSKGNVEVWSKKLVRKRNLAVAIINKSDEAENVSIDWASLDIKGPYTVRDLWLRKNLAQYEDKFQAEIPAHGALLLRFSPVSSNN